MDKKRLLFGLIDMNKTMYNILYTLLCVCVLLIVMVLSVLGLTELEQTDVIGEFNGWSIVFIDVLLLFIGFQIMSKNTGQLHDLKHHHLQITRVFNYFVSLESISTAVDSFE